MFYSHERKEQTGSVNTVWPEMSTRGIDQDDMKKYLVMRGLNVAVAELNGVYPTRNATDNFLRVVIPAVSTKEKHIYYQARAVSQNVHLRYQTPKGPRCGALIFVKAFENKPTKAIVIVEGPMDSLAVASCGYDSVALMGMKPGVLALEHLVKLVAGRPALISLDNEPEAKAAAFDIALKLSSAGSMTFCESPKKGYKDLAEMPPKERLAWLKPRMHELERRLRC